jgi:transposase
LVSSIKKTLKASEQGRKDIALARAEWREFQSKTNANNFVFLDETGVKTNMTRLYGRSLYGERCHDSAPCGNWESITVLSSIRLDGTTECVIFDGAVDRKMFDAYVKEMLVPSLLPGDIVVMDNLSAHKSHDAYKAIKRKQAEILFLPAYSPDLNPIENMWSKVKQLLRGVKARSHEELFDGVGNALSLVSANDARGWFTSCGYTQFES